MTTLLAEQETYRCRLPEMLADEGKYVVIKGDTLLDTFDTYEEATRRGYERFGLEPFFVKKISRVEQVASFTRDFAACLSSH